MFENIYWYKVVFLLEIIVSEFIFSFRLKRRKLFPVRFIVSLVFLFAVAVFIPILSYSAWFMSLLFFSLFALTVIAMYFCFQVPFVNILFCSIASYTLQHIAYILFTLALNVTNITKPNLYTPVDKGNDAFSLPVILLYFLFYVLTYWTGFFALSRKFNPNRDVEIGGIKYLVLSGLIILVDVILNMVTEYNLDGNKTSLYIELIYNLLTCLLSLAIQFGMLYRKEMQTELTVVNQLLKEEEKQYQTIKANSDAINVKVHDLKHYIEDLKNYDGKLDQKELQDMEKSVSLYETIAKTGNDTLDIILTDKSLYCQKNHIRFSSIVDGKLISFMSDSDIYSLFGNAIDNAMEAVLKLEENKREISFSLKSKGNMILFHIENFYKDHVSFNDGLPVTTKGDSTEHGYGVLSMRVVAEKYHGTLSLDVNDDRFALNILFPKQ